MCYYLSKSLNTTVVLEAELNVGLRCTGNLACMYRIFSQTCSYFFLLILHKKSNVLDFSDFYFLIFLMLS